MVLSIQRVFDWGAQCHAGHHQCTSFPGTPEHMAAVVRGGDGCYWLLTRGEAQSCGPWWCAGLDDDDDGGDG